MVQPAKHYVTPDEKIEKAVHEIEDELKESLPNLPPLEAMRLEKRTKYDLELIKELGFCNGIENYSPFAGMKHGTTYDILDSFSYTMSYNLTGWPAAVVRAGWMTGGLPIGVQIVARPWREDVALAVAKTIESACGGFQPPPM